MVSALLDSSVLIDLLRGHPPAQAWFGQQSNLGLTQIVWLELLEGSENKQEQQKALLLLKRFAIVEITKDDMQWAVDKLIRYNLSHNVDAFDCLIASVSARLQIPLFTRNLKHFRPLLDKLAISPY